MHGGAGENNQGNCQKGSGSKTEQNKAWNQTVKIKQ